MHQQQALARALVVLAGLARAPAAMGADDEKPEAQAAVLRCGMRAVVYRWPAPPLANLAAAGLRCRIAGAQPARVAAPAPLRLDAAAAGTSSAWHVPAAVQRERDLIAREQVQEELRQAEARVQALRAQGATGPELARLEVDAAALRRELMRRP